MNLNGIVSSTYDKGVRVTFPGRENAVSNILKIAAHVGPLNVGDNVVVIFFSNNMTDGLVIAKF